MLPPSPSSPIGPQATNGRFQADIVVHPHPLFEAMDLEPGQTDINNLARKCASALVSLSATRRVGLRTPLTQVSGQLKVSRRSTFIVNEVSRHPLKPRLFSASPWLGCHISDARSHISFGQWASGLGGGGWEEASFGQGGAPSFPVAAIFAAVIFRLVAGNPQNGAVGDKYANFQPCWTFLGMMLRLKSTESKGKVYAFGILATTNLAGDRDRRMAVDFAIFRDLFSEADQALWVMATPRQFPQIGDAAQLPSPPPISTIPVEYLQNKFITSLAKAAVTADANDTIVVVICGHGEEHTGSVIIGGPGAYREPLLVTHVEIALDGVKVPQSRIFLLTTACYAGRWRSPLWTLFAAADSDQTSVAMSTSGSGQMRGPDEPRRSVQDVDTRMDSLRRAMGGIYNEANLVIDPAPDTPSRLPIRPFTAGLLERLQVVDSVPSESGDHIVEAVRSDKHTFDVRAVSTEEKVLLKKLATAHNQVPHANVSIDVFVNAMAREVSTGVLLPETDQRMLFECLQYRDRESRRAAAIAKQFGWTSIVPVDQWARGNGLKEMLRAESQGAAIATEFFLDPRVGARWWDPATANSNERPYTTMGPGAWLADTWIRAGEPQVDPVVWANAVGIANVEVGYY
ncbi:hypothetical protein B0H12DRAFT_1242254 [Mycena haematopus]|nr:hypothetical protein B0H12DRAFT_1242254 [Mycena haematopus]